MAEDSWIGGVCLRAVAERGARAVAVAVAAAAGVLLGGALVRLVAAPAADLLVPLVGLVAAHATEVAAGTVLLVLVRRRVGPI